MSYLKEKPEVSSDLNMNTIKRAYQPKLSIPFFATLVALAPSLHLIFDIFDENYDRVLLTSLIVMVSHICIGIMWSRYYYQKSEYKEEVKKYETNPEKYAKMYITGEEISS